MRIRILLVIYTLKNDKMLHSDLYINGKVLNKLEAIHDCEEILIKAKIKKKKLQVIYRDIELTETYKPDKLMKISNFAKIPFDEKHSEPIDELVLPNRYLRLIKKLMSEKPQERAFFKYTESPEPSPPVSPRMNSDEERVGILKEISKTDRKSVV